MLTQRGEMRLTGQCAYRRTAGISDSGGAAPFLSMIPLNRRPAPDSTRSGSFQIEPPIRILVALVGGYRALCGLGADQREHTFYNTQAHWVG